MTRPELQIIYHDIYLTDYPTASCETPDRVRAIMQVLREHYPVVEPEPATEDDVLLVHSGSILRDVKMDPELYDTALMAVGGAKLAADSAYDGTPAFAAVRPPGHHASSGSHWGFCFFNNVAIAVQYLFRARKIASALILDIDLHFGDGTDNFFIHRPNVVVENIQDGDRESFLKRVDRALSVNDYDIIAVSAGFDRHRQDWGGTLKSEDYFTIGRSVRDYAASKCSSRYFAVLEGGYNTEVLGENALALCRGMDLNE
jgi:acetoin utilization deacetylase AcuC-like enzyme